MDRSTRIYGDYFGLRENAFAITPDPGFLFMSERHREALAHLLYGTEAGGGFVQLTGEVGTGKTTVCRAFLQQLPDNVDVALLLSPPEDARALLLAIYGELELKVENSRATVWQLVDRLNAYLLCAHARGRRTVLIIDEAQNISPNVLEQVRLLTNLETSTHKLLQVFLIGQPELRELLKRTSLRQVAQRITARYHLEPLDRQETEGYIRHRLAVGGCRHMLFTRRALARIYGASAGIPRVINTLCDRALLGAFATNAPRVDVRIAWRAVRECRGREPWHRRRLLRPLLAGVLGVMLTAGVMGPQALSRDSGADDAAESVTGISLQARDTAGGAARYARHWPVRVRGSAARRGEDAHVQPVAHGHPGQPGLQVGLLAGLAPDDGAAAVTALLGRWGVAADGQGSLCAQAAPFALACRREEGDLALLRKYNRPALLTLVDEAGQTGRVALLEVGEDEALVAAAGEPQRVKLDALLGAWTGEFVVLWRPPLAGVELIGPGSSGAPVKWLQEALWRFDGQYASRADYDHRLAYRIRQFQEASGLAVDGVAGVMTFIHLNTLLSDGSVPTLTTNTVRF